jgi:hypothetical protein
MPSSNRLLSTGLSMGSYRALLSFAVLFSCLLGLVYGSVVGARRAIGLENRARQPAMRASFQKQRNGRTKVAEGEYAIHEQANGGAVGTFGEEVYHFSESWTLWRVENGQYEAEGVRRFESPKDEVHANRFVVELSRDLTVIRMKEFAKLMWRPDSGPLSCEFLVSELHCSSGGSDPRRAIELRTPLEEPYGLLWPISPFSLSGITREVEQDPKRATAVDLVTIEQPSMANPVEPTILGGSLRYLGKEDIEAAGQKWRAHKFSLKVALHPEFLIWTSSNGLLLVLAVEHEHKNWPEEGMRLARFESFAEF